MNQETQNRPAPGPHGIYRCEVHASDGTICRFVSHSPDLYIEGDYSEDGPGPDASAAIDAIMAGEGRDTVPMKFTRAWLEGLAEADWVASVAFTEDVFFPEQS